MIDVLQEHDWEAVVTEASSSAEWGDQMGWDLKVMIGGFSHSFSLFSTCQ